MFNQALRALLLLLGLGLILLGAGGLVLAVTMIANGNLLARRTGWKMIVGGILLCGFGTTCLRLCPRKRVESSEAAGELPPSAS